MENLIYFCLFVGVGSTILLDLWVTLVEKATSIPPTNWGIVGRWIIGIPNGHWTLDTSVNHEPTVTEKVLGWLFHYIVGIAYAVLIILLFGAGFIDSPSIMPVIIVGLILSTLAGLAILMPALGGGFMGRLIPNWFATFIYLVIAHAIFAIGQYGFAQWFVTLT